MRVVFLLLPRCEAMDVAGPMQALHAANHFGADYRLTFAGVGAELPTEQGLWLSRLSSLPEPREDDLVLVPGGPVATRAAVPLSVLSWLRKAAGAGARIASICTGAFLLGAAGLLDGKECTTHFSRTADLARRFPKARVLSNRLFVTDGKITTSAGIASGVDMALALVEERYGPRVASLAAREMVVYVRRDAAHRQESVYLDFRGHLNPGVHRVQDFLVAHPEEPAPLAKLGRLAAMSVRSLTRQFRDSTGLSVHEFQTRARLERARDLLRSPELGLEAVASRCGFSDARQLRRLWRAAHGEPLSAGRRRRQGP